MKVSAHGRRRPGPEAIKSQESGSIIMEIKKWLRMKMTYRIIWKVSHQMRKIFRRMKRKDERTGEPCLLRQLAGAC